MRLFQQTLALLAAVALAAVLAPAAIAGDCGCAAAASDCGCAAQSDCGCRTGRCHGRKTCPDNCACCEAKTEMEEVEHHYWVCECKTVCLAGPSCGCNGTCGKSRVVKHLIKKTYTCKVPKTKCTAVDGAGACGCGCGCTDGGCDAAPADQAAPMPPATAARRSPAQGALANVR